MFRVQRIGGFYMATKEGTTLEEQLDDAVFQITKKYWKGGRKVFFATPKDCGKSSILSVLQDDLGVAATQEEVAASVGRLRAQKKVALTFMDDGIVYDHWILRLP